MSDRSTTAMPRKGYHHGDLRQALLDAGDGLLRERGVAGFTMRECARRAGVSHAAPAHHFGDARGLLSALASRGYERLCAALKQQIDAVRGDLDAEFAATMRAYLGFARGAPELFRLMFRCDALDMENAELGIAPRRTFVVLTNVILRQRGDPELDETCVELDRRTSDVIADILIGWCHIHGMAHLLIEGQFDSLIDGHADGFIERSIESNAPRLAALLRGSGNR